MHQPSIDIFEQFDQLLLLHLGGYLTYFGRLGLHASDLLAYLQAQPGVEPLQEGHNAASYMLEVTGGSMATLVRQGQFYLRSCLATCCPEPAPCTIPSLPSHICRCLIDRTAVHSLYS